MKPLYRSYQIMALHYVCPPVDPSNNWIKFRNILFATSAVLFMFIFIIASCTFVINNFSTQLMRSIFAILEMAGLSSALYTLLMAYTLRNEITAIFSAFQHIYDSSEISSK